MERNQDRTITRELDRRGAWWIKMHGTSAGRRGVPDVIIIYRGHSITIEDKASGGRVEPLQAHEMRRIERAGGIPVIARSIDDVRQALDLVDTLTIGTEASA